MKEEKHLKQLQSVICIILKMHIEVLTHTHIRPSSPPKHTRSLTKTAMRMLMYCSLF